MLQKPRLRLATDVCWSRHPPRWPDLDRYEAQGAILRQAPLARTVDVCYGERTPFVNALSLW